jgi:hypothetical protein
VGKPDAAIRLRRPVAPTSGRRAAIKTSPHRATFSTLRWMADDDAARWADPKLGGITIARWADPGVPAGLDNPNAGLDADEVNEALGCADDDLLEER